jgi:hypothetical protein
MLQYLGFNFISERNLEKVMLIASFYKYHTFTSHIFTLQKLACFTQNCDTISGVCNYCLMMKQKADTLSSI